MIDDNLLDMEPPSGGKPEGWLWGMVVAIPLMTYGIICVATRHAWFLRTYRRRKVDFQGPFFELHDRPAMALGLAIFCLGAMLHFHWYWGNHERLGRYYEIGRFIALLGFTISVYWCLYETFAR